MVSTNETSGPATDRMIGQDQGKFFEVATLENGLKVMRGFGAPDEVLAQLIDNSLQKPIKRYTPNDAGFDNNDGTHKTGRFESQETFGVWTQKGKNRAIYWLMDGDALAGIVWHATEGVPKYTVGKVDFGDVMADESQTGEAPHTTMAIRIYDGYHHKGNGTPFLHAAEIDYVANLSAEARREFTGMWLETDTDGDGQYLYGSSKNGYKTVWTEAADPEKGQRVDRLFMVQTMGQIATVTGLNLTAKSS